VVGAIGLVALALVVGVFVLAHFVIRDVMTPDRLGDQSTCLEWRTDSSLDDHRAYVHHDGYYSDDSKRMTELDQLCATSPDDTTLYSLRDRH
jgi:hypothetical protein